MLQAFVPRESEPGETRVAATPDTVKKLIASGLAVAVEKGAGERASFLDAAYVAAGATVVADRAAGLAAADLVLQLQPPRSEAELPKSGAALVSFLYPAARLPLVKAMAQRGVTGFAMELIPRISRAQRMDALSSQSNIAGYKAVLMAADALGKLMPMLMTAAGTITPARVVILGAGVAGLQAIATARRLGALVEVSDIRPAVKEQVESLGAKFIEVAVKQDAEDKGGYAKEASAEFKKAQEEALKKRVAEADVVICTALIPGKPAPKLLPTSMVEAMRPGSVVVDLAAEQGGNCELTRPGETATSKNGVVLLGVKNVPALVPVHASDMYAKNVLYFVQHLVKAGALHVDVQDEITAGCLVTRGGQVVHAPTAALIPAGVSS
ncbi:MAG: Re/Si-specific NAD(P)(+) transhydrogenase subunit alpha [Planctomycetes bacterium]|nr:Re/Si-specific NAD(P)(+) transhydrogenase subunit alpha [Planctomycetota bacterium]